MYQLFSIPVNQFQSVQKLKSQQRGKNSKSKLFKLILINTWHFIANYDAHRFILYKLLYIMRTLFSTRVSMITLSRDSKNPQKDVNLFLLLTITAF